MKKCCLYSPSNLLCIKLTRSNQIEFINVNFVIVAIQDKVIQKT